jgi:hypothetical protein
VVFTATTNLPSKRRSLARTASYISFMTWNQYWSTPSQYARPEVAGSGRERFFRNPPCKVDPGFVAERVLAMGAIGTAGLSSA